MSATNRSKARHPEDFYRTPSWAVHALLDSEPLHGPILEPACGDGAILDELRGAGLFPLVGVELNPDRWGAVLATLCSTRTTIHRGDFLCPDEILEQRLRGGGFASVVANPPYGQAADFIRRALNVVQPGGRVCMLLRLNFLGSSRKRLDVVGPGSGLARVIVLAKRPSFTGGRTDACEYAWMIWIRGHTGEARISVYSAPTDRRVCEGNQP